MFEFQYPYLFLLLLLFAFGEKFLKPKQDAIVLSGILTQKTSKTSYMWLLKWFGIFFLILAMASPISKKEFIPHKEPTHAIMLDLDVSGSMRGDKIEVAKKMGAEFIEKRKDDHVGLVAFGSFAYVAAPLTFDLKATSELLKRMQIGIAGQYTALRDGIFMTIRMLKRSKAKEKIIVLLTDGYDKGSHISPNALQKAIKSSGIKIYSIGIGYRGDYDARFLQAIAKISGGEFYQATSADSLRRIYDNIDSLEKTKLETRKIVQKFYYFQYPLFLALLFFVLFLYFKVKGGK